MPDILDDSTYQIMLKINENQLSPLLVINDVVIRDTIKFEYFKQKYLDSIKKISYLSQKQALKNYGIKSEDGVLLIYTKKKRVIDL